MKYFPLEGKGMILSYILSTECSILDEILKTTENWVYMNIVLFRNKVRFIINLFGTCII
jgi:hypothetical protein